MFENKERTELADFGEFGLINHIAQHFPISGENTILGIGDDAAVIKAGDENILISSDLLLEGVHFDLAFHPLKHLGYKAVTVNVSNICAMNGVPEQIAVNIAISNRFSLEAVEEFFAGVKLACEKYKIDLIGGDTSSSRSGFVISVTTVGRVSNSRLVKRSGASESDLLVVSGDIGGAYMGLQILEREKRVFLEHPNMQPDLEMYDYIVGRQLRPESRLDVINLLIEKDIVPTSMINVADGVASEIHHLGQRSEVGFDIYEEKLPLDPQTIDTALQFQLNPSIAALNGGEDFELLFTIKQQDYDKIKNNPDFTVIGHATANKGKYRLITTSGNAFDIQAQGWQQFEK